MEDYAVIIAFLYKRLEIVRGYGHVRSKGDDDRAHVRLELYGFSFWCCHGMLEEYTCSRFIYIVNPRLVVENYTQ
jgi:hypothetical protein